MENLNIKTVQILTVATIVLTITITFIYNVINHGFTNF